MLAAMTDQPDSPTLGATMRVHRPAPGVLAFYDGRVPGVRAWSAAPNWLDDGAYALGIASYAIVSDGEAIVYDTHLSCAHARIVRRSLDALGVGRITVVLSHSHADHVAGNAVFADCEILAHPLTLERLTAERAALEAGEPPIAPLVLPTRTVGDGEVLAVGGRRLTVRHFDIHSRDGTVLLLPEAGGLLLAGDTLEDPVTYVDEPDRLARHLGELERLAALAARRILPAHGAEARIAGGGFGPDLIAAAQAYLARLLACRTDPALAALDLRAFIGTEVQTGAVAYFAPYEPVHAANVAAVLAVPA